jgi:hypothetical protein
MIRLFMVCVIGCSFFAAGLLSQQGSPETTYSLKPTPKTVAWGYYDAKAAPVLRIKSGNTLGKMDPHGIRTLTVQRKNLRAGVLPDVLC